MNAIVIPLTKLLVSLLIFVGIIYLYIKSDSHYFLKTKEYKGTVINKFKDSKNRNRQTLEILTSSNEYIYISGWGYCYTLYDDSTVGDSIIKIKDSYKLILKRKEIILNTYVFETYDNTSCYGYKRMEEGE